MKRTPGGYAHENIAKAMTIAQHHRSTRNPWLECVSCDTVQSDVEVCDASF